MWYTCSWNLCTMPFPQLRLRLRPAIVRVDHRLTPYLTAVLACGGCRRLA